MEKGRRREKIPSEEGVGCGTSGMMGIKIVFVGDTGTGKTCIVRRIAEGAFDPDCPPTFLGTYVFLLYYRVSSSVLFPPIF